MATKSIAPESEVNCPLHYMGDGKIECKDAMRSMMTPRVEMPGLCYGWWYAAFKYLWRWPLKNGIQDLKKARRTIDYLIEELEKNNDQVG